MTVSQLGLKVGTARNCHWGILIETCVFRLLPNV